MPLHSKGLKTRVIKQCGPPGSYDNDSSHVLWQTVQIQAAAAGKVLFPIVACVRRRQLGLKIGPILSLNPEENHFTYTRQFPYSKLKI